MRGGRWIEENLYSQIRQLLPIACVDILAVHNGRLLLLLRNFEPAKDFWFTPGGRINYGETLEQAALRELREETGLAATRLEKKGVMSHFYRLHTMSQSSSALKFDVTRSNSTKSTETTSGYPNRTTPFIHT